MARTTGSHCDITGPKVRRAALTLFARHGYAAVSMRQIAGAVGVQAGALYNYTPDKQTLLFSLMQGHMEALLTARADLPSPEDPVEGLEGFERFHIHFHLARPDAVFIAYMELRNLEPGNFAEIERLRRAYEDALEDILRAGVAAGVCDIPDTRIATRAVIAMLTGVMTWYRADGLLTPDALADCYWSMTQAMVGAG